MKLSSCRRTLTYKLCDIVLHLRSMDDVAQAAGWCCPWILFFCSLPRCLILVVTLGYNKPFKDTQQSIPVMEEPVIAKRRKLSRPAPLAPLRCHVVDDHCDALKHIHAAIRRRALPFEGVSMMHWDAHPDLMVPPDMSADTCFCPQELYVELSASEGGIAEWILPMVYQGHLSKLWWIRPPWARQFMDGHYRFSVGKAEATGMLRVSSTAPYFVDDRLYCSEECMQSCKPVHLFVSLAHDGGIPAASAPATAMNRGSGEECGAEAPKTRAMVKPVRPINPRNVVDVESIGNKEPIPWVLDICLDYFTCENPFILELESRIGKVDADLVRTFYEKPLFRGPATVLPHDVQVEHERLFKTEVEWLLDTGTEVSHLPAEADKDAKRSGLVGGSIPPFGKFGEVPDHTSVKNSTLGAEKKAVGFAAVGVPRESQKDDGGSERRECGLQRLTNLFSKDGDDQLLPGKFAAIVSQMGPAERKLVAWVDHCACLPRYLATREEVRESVRRAEGLLRAEMSVTGSGDWGGRPGVVTVARSAGDGYVPSDMVEFVEGEVLTMLERLFGDGADPAIGGGGLEVLYEEGLEYALR